METVTFPTVTTEQEIKDIAVLAKEIWNQHFVAIIGQAQVDYMVEKFQSYSAIQEQIQQEGYEYFQIRNNQKLVGYLGVRQEPDTLFLSKLYVHKDARGQHLATRALHFLIALCQERQLSSIYLTCNKHNEDSLKIYDHLGFTTTGTQCKDIGGGFVMDDYIMTYQISENGPVSC